MANETKKPRHAMRAFALALVSCLALAAATASTSAAVSIQASEYPLGFTVSGGDFQGFPTHHKVLCNSETTGSGSLVDESTGTVSLEFHGCEVGISGWPKCQSSGAASGTIVTEPLTINTSQVPDEENNASYKPGVVLDPTNLNNVFAEFTCASFTVKWSGGLIGEIAEPGYEKPSGVLGVEFRGYEAVQEFTETYHGWNAHLDSSFSGGGAEEMSLKGSVYLTYGGGEEVSLSDDGGEHPNIFLTSDFPTPVSISSNNEVTLRPSGNGRVIHCTASGKIPAVSGSGEFSSSSSGAAELTFHNCKESIFNSNCTTPGQSSGTVRTGYLPVQLTYLADHGPGISLGGGGAFAEMKCLGGLITLKVTGDVLGGITSEFGQKWFSLFFDFNAVEEGEEYAQEYTETEDGEELGLQATSNGGTASSELMDMNGGSTFGEWSVSEEGEIVYVELTE